MRLGYELFIRQTHYSVRMNCFIVHWSTRTMFPDIYLSWWYTNNKVYQHLYGRIVDVFFQLECSRIARDCENPEQRRRPALNSKRRLLFVDPIDLSKRLNKNPLFNKETIIIIFTFKFGAGFINYVRINNSGNICVILMRSPSNLDLAWNSVIICFTR